MRYPALYRRVALNELGAGKEYIFAYLQLALERNMTDKYAIAFTIVASKFKTHYRVQY